MKKGGGAQGRDRTTDTRIFSPLLYQLSYLGEGAALLKMQQRMRGFIETIMGPVQPPISTMKQ